VIKAWVQNLESQKEDPAIIELLAKNDALKKELEETQEQFIFEQNYGGPHCQDTKIGSNKSYAPPFQHPCVL
jgi:hypothetical protein